MAQKMKSKEHKHKAKADKGRKSSTERNGPAALTLLADTHMVDPNLSSLFAVKQPPVKAKAAPVRTFPPEPATDDDLGDEAAALTDPEDDNDVDDANELELDAEPSDEIATGSHSVSEIAEEPLPKRKRKRKDGDDNLEDDYLNRLARENKKDAERIAKERSAKRQKVGESTQVSLQPVQEDGEEEDDDDEGIENRDDDGPLSPPPKHETEAAADEELDKAGRTVFLGNVSTTAITSKSARKQLERHLGSFFASIAAQKDSAKHKVESIRFRSTPYASAIPKKAAYAKQELMDATTKSTNAYAVYSTPALAREACKRLNGTVILERHLRVDSVAHPAKVDHRRCVFVGNLGFVDDESNIQQANEDEGREVRKRGKEPADVEEGLWRSFGKCGKVESVRVIRDSTTRVGKGIAYVQFEDENGVEAALLYNEKKFPPMLPRKLRVSRAKAQKRNAKPGSGRPGSNRPNVNEGYQRKYTSEETSKMGRAGKLLGRAAAAQMSKTHGGRAPAKPAARELGASIRKPEDFVFEGHRASSKAGKVGLKLGGRTKKAKPRVTKRSASFKTKAKK